MSETAWRLRRLGAMPAAEVWRRARRSLRERLWPPAYASWPPEEAFRRLFACPPGEALRGSRLGLLVRLPETPDPSAFAPTLRAAAGLRAGRWELFGHGVVLDDPPAWRRNPLTGAEWPDQPAARLDYRRAGPAGGAKYAWELGRLTLLPTLALAYRLTGDGAGAALAARWLDDWNARNPLGHGIHHTSGIEMAVRTLTVSWALALLGDRAADLKLAPCLGLVAQQALHCRDHLSLGSSANNHLIAEYAAMTVTGAAFPALRGGGRLLEEGLAGLERETLCQIHPDGVPAEQAFGYLPFVWELLLCGFVAAERAGREAGAAVRDRLRASLDFARVIRLPGGRWPQVGDEDDGRVLLAAEGASRLDLAGGALAAWLGEPPLAEDGGALALLLFGESRGAPGRPAERCHQFPAGGYTVYRERGLLATWDHGPLGLGSLAAHGHADALAVTLFRGEDAVIVDPGTYAYHEDAPARDRFRSTPYHSTASFGGRSQSEMLGPFLWGKRARLVPRDEGWECEWWTGERHWRRVTLVGHRLRIEDRVVGPAPELVFVLHPEAEVRLEARRAAVRIGRTAATFVADGLERWELEAGEFSPRFGHRQETRRLVARLRDSTCRTEVDAAPA